MESKGQDGTGRAVGAMLSELWPDYMDAALTGLEQAQSAADAMREAARVLAFAGETLEWNADGHEVQARGALYDVFAAFIAAPDSAAYLAEQVSR